ncbi:hypothetical protein D9M70_508160 [compost metagenome]
MQHLRQIVLGECGFQLMAVEVIGEEIFHPCETGFGGESEAIHERHFVKKHGEIGCKSWHFRLLYFSRQL